PLPEVVPGDEEREPIWVCRVAADPADEHLVDPCRLTRRRELLDADARGSGEDLRRLLRPPRLLELGPDGFGWSDHRGLADARGADRQVGQLHDLARLLTELRLLVELDAVEIPVHSEVVRVLRLVAEPLHRGGAGARDRL